jgi:hypothetical protein
MLLVLCGLMAVTSCKKEEENNKLNIGGRVVDYTTGVGVSGATVKLAQKVLDGGTFSNIFQPVATVSSASNGSYNFAFERNAASEYRIEVEKDSYFGATQFINPDDVTIGGAFTSNLPIAPMAWARWTITNTNPIDNNDYVSFQYLNASFDCECCTLDEVEFTGTSVDETEKCLLIGNYNLKYRYVVYKDTINYSQIDSVICAPFDTTNIVIQY